MKKLAILSILLYCISVAYSQNCCDEVKKQAIEMYGLQKKLDQEKDTSEQKLQAANDSIKLYKTEISSLDFKIKNLEKDITELNKKLDKKNISQMESQLKEKRDSIIKLQNLLSDTIIAQSNQIIAINQKSEEIKNQNYAKGQQRVYSQIAEEYHNKTFDELINTCTKQSVERDLLLIGDDTLAKRKLQNLQKYFDAQSILKHQFDAQKLQNAQRQLGQLDSISAKSNSVGKLKESIEYYERRSNALKKTINKINEIDDKFTANDDNTQLKKLQDILTELASYFRNYRFNLTDYPYLSDTVLEIMKRKQLDANTSIRDLLNKL